MCDTQLTGILTLVGTMGGVVLGFILTQMVAVIERNRERIKKLRFFQQRLLLLSITPQMFIADLDSRGNYDKTKDLYDESDISVIIRELSEILYSIDFKEKDIHGVCANFEYVRRNVEKIKQVFKRYERAEIPALDIFYSELDEACKNLQSSIGDLRKIISDLSKDYSIYGSFRRICKAFFH